MHLRPRSSFKYLHTHFQHKHTQHPHTLKTLHWMPLQGCWIQVTPATIVGHTCPCATTNALLSILFVCWTQTTRSSPTCTDTVVCILSLILRQGVLGLPSGSTSRSMSLMGLRFLACPANTTTQQERLRGATYSRQADRVKRQADRWIAEWSGFRVSLYGCMGRGMGG